MSFDRTFAMLKPGVIQRRIVGEIITRIERKGLKIIGLKIMNIPPLLATTHYAEHKGKDFYEKLIEYISSGPVVAMALEGDDVVQIVRKLCGPTSVCDSNPGTIRGDYCMHTNHNIIHASDSQESAKRELGLFFTENELISWEDGNQKWF